MDTQSRIGFELSKSYVYRPLEEIAKIRRGANIRSWLLASPLLLNASTVKLIGGSRRVEIAFGRSPIQVAAATLPNSAVLAMKKSSKV
jgi:hypothetical protein